MQDASFIWTHEFCVLRLASCVLHLATNSIVRPKERVPLHSAPIYLSNLPLAISGSGRKPTQVAAGSRQATESNQIVEFGHTNSWSSLCVASLARRHSRAAGFGSRESALASQPVGFCPEAERRASPTIVTLSHCHSFVLIARLLTANNKSTRLAFGSPSERRALGGELGVARPQLAQITLVGLICTICQTGRSFGH